MIIALQILILFRESVLTLLNGWLSPFFIQLVRKLSENGLNPVNEDIEEHVFADYDDENGVVFFPPVNAQRYAAVCDCLMDERWFGRLEKVLNIGKHYDTNFMRYVTEVSGITQVLCLDIACSLNCPCDILALPINGCERWAKPLQITLLQGNAADPDYRLIGCDAVIGIEIIQKLLPHDLDRLVHNVFGFIKPWVALFTTPNADFNCLLKNLNNNGLRQSDHYFEWTREQLHDWCSNIVRRYPEYMVMSRGVGPGPKDTSHYGCFSQLVLFISKHYIKEMDINVNSLVMISNLPEPEQVSEIGLISRTSAASAHSMFHRQLEAESPEFQYSTSTSQSSSEGTVYLSGICGRTLSIDSSVQCNLDVEYGKKFIMFDDDEIYQIRVARRRLFGNVYEIGDVARRLNNTMYTVKQFSKTSQYLMEKNEMDSKDMMDEILQLTEKLTCKINQCSGDECSVWKNVNWGENVPYWNQYYKVVGVFNFPYEGKSEDDVILEILSEEAHRLFGKHDQCGNLEIPVNVLMDSVKHITDDVERVIMLMEDFGYELEGDSVVYSGIDVSEDSNNEEFESDSNSDSGSSGSSSGRDSDGRLLNRTLGRKIKMLRLMLPEQDDIKQALGLVVCRLKKVALSSGPGLQGSARSKWLQSKFLELLTLTEKSILRKKLRNVEVDPLKFWGCGTADETAKQLSKIKAEDDITMKIVTKYETLLRMAGDNLDDLRNEHGSVMSFPPKCTDNRENGSDGVYQLNDVKAVHSLDDRLTADVQECEEKDTSLYEEETNETTVKDSGGIITPKQSKHNKSHQEKPVKIRDSCTKKHISNNSNSKICKNKSKHSASLDAVKKSLKNTRSFEIMDIINDKSRSKPERVLNKMTYDKTLDCIDKIGKKMGPTLILSIPSKPIPDSILELCHPELHQKTTDRFQNLNYSWSKSKDTPVAATEHSQKVEILSQSATQIVALQRMIGTDPDVDAEIYEHDLELSDLASLINDTSYFARNESPCAVHASSVFVPTNEESALVNNAVIEIITQDGRELIALQRSVGIGPEVDTEAYEQELRHSKLTTSLSTMVSFEKIPVSLANVSSQEFFLYDLNEPTTSKGIRHVNMDVQCGTESQISATTSFTSPFKMLKPTVEYETLNYDVPAVLKNDCVTSTHDILRPRDSIASPWMKHVGIKIKDSNHQIKDTSKETDGYENCINKLTQNYINSKCKVMETPHSNRIVGGNPDHTQTKIIKIRGKNTNSPSLYNLRNSNEIIKKDYNIRSVQFLHVPRALQSKLSCGGVHVHSYKDLQVSEDVVYQGEWQRHRRCNILKHTLLSKERLKLTRKPSALPKPQKPIFQKAIDSPIIIRNTKANKMKEARTKMQMQTKLASTKHEVHKNRSNWQVTHKSTVSYSKSIKEKPSKFNQPTRYTRFAPKPTIINENSFPTTQKRKVYIPPYLAKMTKKQQILKQPSKIHDKTGSQSNLLNVNNEQITSKQSLSKVDDLLCALYKVSVELPKDMSYVVYRNKIDSSNCSNAIENSLLTTIPSREDRQKLSNRSQTSKGTVALNPLITNLDPIQSKRPATPIKSNLRRKGSNSRMTSRIKKLTNIMFSKKSNNNIAKDDYSLGNSATSQNEPKNMSSVDSFKERQAIDSSSSKASIKSSSKRFLESSDSENGSSITDKRKEYSNKPDSRNDLVLECSKSNIQDLKTDSVLDCSEAESDTHESVKTQILVKCPNESSNRDLDNQAMPNPTDITKNITHEYTNNLHDEMKEFVEECLSFDDTDDVSKLILNKMIENVSKHSDSDNNASNESETYETGSSFRRTYDARSSTSLMKSFTDFSCESLSSALKVSERIADGSWHNVMPSQHGGENQVENKDTISIAQTDVSMTPSQMDVPSTATIHSSPLNEPSSTSVTDTSLQPQFNSEVTIPSSLTNELDKSADREILLVLQPKTENPRAGLAFSSFSVNTQPSPLGLGQQPDYVNLVDSETGSCARTSRRATSEEVLVSDRSSESYVSCVLDEDAAIPSWMYNDNQQASSSFSSGRYVIVPEAVPELEYDVNGNELTAHGAGAGDGCGIHSDISQDSSGQGTSFSSSGSSRVHSEAVVVDPSSFLAGFAPGGGQANPSAAAVAEESIDNLDVATSENQNRGANRSRILRPIHRISLPASDADVSSLDTDLASD